MSEAFEVFQILREDHDGLSDLFEGPAHREGTELDDDEWQVLFTEPPSFERW